MVLQACLMVVLSGKLFIHATLSRRSIPAPDVPSTAQARDKHLEIIGVCIYVCAELQVAIAEMTLIDQNTEEFMH